MGFGAFCTLQTNVCIAKTLYEQRGFDVTVPHRQGLPFSAGKLL